MNLTQKFTYIPGVAVGLIIVGPKVGVEVLVGVWDAVGGTEVLVDVRVEVGGTDVFVGVWVDVGGTDVFVGVWVDVGGTDVFVGVWVDVGGTDVFVFVWVGVEVDALVACGGLFVGEGGICVVTGENVIISVSISDCVEVEA